MTSPSNRNSDDGLPDTLHQRWLEFVSQYGSEADCWEALFSATGGGKCQHCGSEDIDRAYGARVAKCRSCDNTTRLTAGTFFQNIRNPQAWFGAIWLFEHGEIANANQFHKLAKVAYSTAWEIYRKISLVVQNDMEAESDSVSLSSGLFARLFSKRSLETPAHVHPIEEQTEMEKSEWGAAQSDPSASPGAHGASPGMTQPGVPTPFLNELSGPAKEVNDCLSKEPISLEELCNLTKIPAGQLSAILVMLELDERALGLAGNKFVRSTPAVRATAAPRAVASPNVLNGFQPSTAEDIDSELMSPINVIVRFFKETFHGMARKYLQLYLALRWCYLARDRWQEGALLRACSQFGTVDSEDIRAYVTPPLVKVLPRF